VAAPTPDEETRPSVVDAHTHVFPPEVIQSRDSSLKRDTWFEHLYADPIAQLVTADELIESMDAAGIEQSVVCGFPWFDAGICCEHNDYLSEVCRESNGRLFWLGIVSPVNGDEAAAEAARCFTLGARGLGELNADSQRFDLTSQHELAPIVDVCVELDRPLMFHVTEPLGHAYRGKGTATPDRLVAFLSNFPEARIVAAHWGGGLPFYDLMPEITQIAQRVVYDSAASTYLYRFDVFRTVLDLVGAERVMFASDFPILRQDRFLKRVEQIPWRNAVERRFTLGDTARSVFKIPPVVSHS
jgi:predicted TIM-barrel fold metal-dependent hydrolase